MRYIYEGEIFVRCVSSGGVQGEEGRCGEERCEEERC